MSDLGDMAAGERGEDSVLAAEYVLGLLGPAEHDRASLRIQQDPEFASEVRRWRAHFATLDAAFEPVSAPFGAFKRIERRLFGPEPRRGGLWNSLAFWRGLAGAGLATTFLALGFALLWPRQADPEAVATQLVAALQSVDSGVSFVALYDADAGTVRLVGLSGAPVPERDFELWAIEGEGAPISMGVVGLERHSVPLSEQVAQGFGEGTVLAVTLEPEGGSPTGGPTGPVVAQGAATAI